MKQRKVMMKAISTVISAALAVCALPVMVSADQAIPGADQQIVVPIDHAVAYNQESSFADGAVTIKPTSTSGTDQNDSKINDEVPGSGVYYFKARHQIDSDYLFTINSTLYTDYEIIGISFNYGQQIANDTHTPISGTDVVTLTGLGAGVTLDHDGGQIFVPFTRGQSPRRSFEFTMTSSSAGTSYYVPISNLTIYLGIRPDSVTVSPATASIDVTQGQTQQLTAAVAPTNCTYPVTWSSSDESIATVSSTGEVTGVAPGTATITATCDDKTGSSTITVTQSATSVSITNLPDHELVPGEDHTLTGVVEPGTATGTRAWTSSDTNVATVDSNGKVTAVAAGTANITFSCGSVSSTPATITVSDYSVSLSPDSVSLVYGGATGSTALTIDSRLAYTSITWNTTGNCFTADTTNIAAITITPTAVGSGTLTATVNYNGGSLTATCSINVDPAGAVSVTASNHSTPYDGSSHSFGVDSVTPGTATVLYGDSATTCSSANPPSFTAIGNYTVYYEASAPGYYPTSGCYIVSITDPTPVPVPIDPGSVVINGGPDSGELVVGDTWQLSSGYTPDNATITSVVWTSSDESVATVDSTGKITAIAPGTAVITVTYNNDPALSYSITITVTEPAPGPEPGPEPGPSPEPPEPTPEPEPDPEPTLTPEQIRQMSITQFVERLYLTALGRQHEIMGRDYWVDHLNNDYSGSYVGTGFIHSQEFLGFDLNDDEYVNSLYRAFCDRLPSDAERTNWTNALAGGATRDQVLSEFLASQEWDSICAFYSVKTH